MKILFLTLRCPFPPHRGDRIRSYNLIKQLSDRHSITVVSFVESDREVEQIRELEKFCDRVEWVKFDRAEAKRNMALNFFSQTPFQISHWRSAEMQRKIDQLLDENSFDLVHAHLIRMGQYVENVDLPKVIDLCDSMALNLDRRIKFDKWFKKPLLELEKKRVQKYEIEIAKKFDHATVITKFDHDYLKDLDNSISLSVVTGGIDLDYFRSSAEDRDEMHLLFTGTMSYFPNYDAVLYFHDKIFPIVSERFPNVKFSVVGTDPISAIKQIASEKVIVTGRVPDTRIYFDQATVFVSALRSGSGLQRKHLEAMAMEIPIVTTTIGAEGLNAISEKDLMIADTPRDFADAIIRLLSDSGLRSRIAQNARRLIEQKFDWIVLGKELETVYKEVVGC